MSDSSKKLRRGRSSRQSSKNPPLFADVKAWFSATVSRDKQLAWIKHGGQCSDWQEAQLLFSEDVKAKDTMCLFEQMEFLWGYVTVFHASFITACTKEKSMKNVAIATYLMLPPEYPLVDTKDVPGGSSQTTVPTTRRDRIRGDNAPSSAIVRHSSGRDRVREDNAPSSVIARHSNRHDHDRENHAPPSVIERHSNRTDRDKEDNAPSSVIVRHSSGCDRDREDNAPSSVIVRHSNRRDRDREDNAPSSVIVRHSNRRDRDKEDNAPSSAIVGHSSRRRRRLQLSKQSLQSLSSARIEKNTYPKYQSCGSCENSFQFCHGVEEACLEENEMPYCDLRSIPHVNSLRQTSLPLSDFIPGQNGCTVGRKAIFDSTKPLFCNGRPRLKELVLSMGLDPKSVT